MRYLILLLLPFTAYAVDVKTYIPTNAIPLIPLVIKEQKRLLPQISNPEYFCGLIEHESCISLKHPRCWNSRSQLKTKREHGVGLGQLTKAFKANGTIRFDALSDLRRIYITELRELSWGNISVRPDLQIRAILLMTLSNYNSLYKVNDSFQRLAMADAAYNGGIGDVLKARTICGLKKFCNPQIWFNHVDSITVKSTKPIYGTLSPDAINKRHVKDVLFTRMPKYKQFYKLGINDETISTIDE